MPHRAHQNDLTKVCTNITAVGCEGKVELWQRHDSKRNYDNKGEVILIYFLLNIFNHLSHPRNDTLLALTVTMAIQIRGGARTAGSATGIYRS